jgi:hypothetical protein
LPPREETNRRKKPFPRSGWFREQALLKRSLSALFLVAALLALSGCAPAVNLGLRAEEPRQRLYPPDEPPVSFVAVDSLRPTLKWERFPRREDPAGYWIEIYGPAPVRDVRYQLKLSAFGDRTWRYERINLEEPAHTIEVELKPDTKYLWTVRACFLLGGEQRCTEWGAVSYWERQEVVHPNFSSYRFKTPKK